MDSLEASRGAHGFQRLTTGQTGDWEVLKAINADVTFGAGCTVKAGDAPQDADVLQQGDFLPGRFTKVVFSTGTLLGYPSTPIT